MIWKLALLFTVVPAIELAVLITIGTYLGVIPTTLIILATGFTGAWLAKREGLGVLRRMRTDLQRGLPPAGRIMEGVLVVAGGLLLITPGIFTDIAGFLFIIPWSRRLIAPVVLRWIVRWFTGNPDLAASIDVRFSADEPADTKHEPVQPEPLRQDPHFDHPVR